jgi:SAM-dependent methyltransferase
VTEPLVDPFYTDFAQAYDEHSQGVRGDVEFYRDLALEAGGLTVELGVGTGRIAIPCAEAGAQLLGLDLSRQMLAIARRKAAASGVEGLALAQADMRRFALARPAQLVTIPYRAFLHNLTTEDQLATLEACRGSLEPGGRLALNVFNPDIAKIADWLQRGPDEWEDRPGGGSQRHTYEPAGQRVDSSMLLPSADRRPRRVEIRLRYVYRHELEHLLARTSFAIERLEGDFFGAPFGPLSTEMVCVAQAI